MADPQSTGTMAGTVAGAGIGAFFGPGGALLGASAGGAIGGAIGGLFGKKRRGILTQDISAELARIDAIITQARAQARAAIDFEAGVSRRGLAAQLAQRGVYPSPAATIPFEGLESARLAAISKSEADLLGQSAQLRAGALQNIFGQNLRAQEFNIGLAEQERAQKQQSLASLLSSLGGLGASLYFSQPGVTKAPSGQSSLLDANRSYQSPYFTPTQQQAYGQNPYYYQPQFFLPR